MWANHLRNHQGLRCPVELLPNVTEELWQSPALRRQHCEGGWRPSLAFASDAGDPVTHRRSHPLD